MFLRFIKINNISGVSAHQNWAFCVPKNLMNAAGRFPLISGGKYAIIKLAKNPISKMAAKIIGKKEVSRKVMECFRTDRLRIAKLMIKNARNSPMCSQNSGLFPVASRNLSK